MKSLSRVQLFATPWTLAHQASPSTGFSRQEYWSGLPFRHIFLRSLSPIGSQQYESNHSSFTYCCILCNSTSMFWVYYIHMMNFNKDFCTFFFTFCIENSMIQENTRKTHFLMDFFPVMLSQNFWKNEWDWSLTESSFSYISVAILITTFMSCINSTKWTI